MNPKLLKSENNVLYVDFKPVYTPVPYSGTESEIMKQINGYDCQVYPVEILRVQRLLKLMASARLGLEE